jgi:hypothetical protein
MPAIADDAQIEPAVPGTAGPSGVDPHRALNKQEFGQSIKPLMASIRGYQVEDVKLTTVSATEVQVSGTVTVLMAGRPSLQHRDRLWTFEPRGKRWLVVRAQYL